MTFPPHVHRGLGDGAERPTLRLDTVLTAHKLLIMDLSVTPGEFRMVPARCGNRHLVPPAEIAGLMEELVSALAVVLARRDLMNEREGSMGTGAPAGNLSVQLWQRQAGVAAGQLGACYVRPSLCCRAVQLRLPESRLH